MNNGETDPDITELLADLTRELRRLQREVEPEPRRRLPTPHELARFTSEVAIPGLILLLQTQIRALELLRRTIRLAEGREPTRQQRTVRKRAEQLGTTTLSQLDSVLTELQSATEGRPEDDRASQLLDDAKQLQEQIRSEFEAHDASEESTHQGSQALGESQADAEISKSLYGPAQTVNIDVEEELRSLKDAVDDTNQPADSSAPSGSADDGDADGEDTGDS